MRLDKIYTRTGDGGRTSLVSGERVKKSALRVEAFGTVDELNSFIGLLRTLGDGQGEGAEASMQAELRRIQNDLFDIGSLLATRGEAAAAMPAPDDARVRALEEWIDGMQADLEPLRSFVLPGGNLPNAYAHVARAVCRRAERSMWRLHEEEPLPEVLLQYVNRLSDFLFVYARWIARTAGAAEYLWDRPLG